MGMIWFTADTHFGHEGIVEFTKRPFKGTDHMDESLIKRWNECVKPDDTVFFLGDFCFGSTNKKAAHWLKKLNGTKIFVRGNHDKNNGIKTKIVGIELEYGGTLFYCMHDPADLNSYYSLNLCGHVHEHWMVKRWGSTYLINVGVDVWNYYPVSFEEIQDRLTKFENYKLVDTEQEIEDRLVFRAKKKLFENDARKVNKK